MTTRAYHSTAERFGHWLGGLWRGYVRWERRLAADLARRWRVSVPLTQALFRVARMVALALLVYATFGFVLAVAMVALVVAAVLLVSPGDAKRDQTDEVSPVTTFDTDDHPGYDPWPHHDVAHSQYPDELDR